MLGQGYSTCCVEIFTLESIEKKEILIIWNQRQTDGSSPAEHITLVLQWVHCEITSSNFIINHTQTHASTTLTDTNKNIHTAYTTR